MRRHGRQLDDRTHARVARDGGEGLWFFGSRDDPGRACRSRNVETGSGCVSGNDTERRVRAVILRTGTSVRTAVSASESVEHR